jgi:hypothetical protein
MMRVLIPTDDDFDRQTCRSLYNKYKKVLNEASSFDEVIKNTFFYSFYDDSALTLCVYFFVKDGKLWVNGFGERKHHLFNKKCFEKALTWFNCDIWAESVEKPAIFGIKTCGFKKYKNNIYVYRQKT